MTFTTAVTGIGAAQYTGSEAVNSTLLEAFMTSLAQFYQVKTSGTPATAADLANIQNQINLLSQVAQNGVSVNLDSSTPADPTPGSTTTSTSPNSTFYMNTTMVNLLNTLFTSISPSGNISNLTLSQLQAWQTETSTNDIQNVFVAAARLYAILPPATPGGATSAISLDSTTAAQQIARIFTQSTFTSASINYSATQSLQSFTELEYVETANQVINTQLTNLQSALQSTQTALTNLNSLQQVHNNVTVNSRTFTFNINPPSTAPNEKLSTFTSQYQLYASSQLKAALVPQLNTEALPFSLPASAVHISAYISNGKTGTSADWVFTAKINNPNNYYAFNTSTNQFSTVLVAYRMSGYYVSNVNVNPLTFSVAQISQIVGDGYNGTQTFPLLGTLSGMATYQTQLVAQEQQLSALVKQLSAVTPSADLTGLARSQALVGQVSTVLSNLKANLSTTTSTTPTLTAAVGIRKWIMDNYQTLSSPSAANAGVYQQNITNAITAAESANSTQTQNVNNAFLIFQQYYQSAAEVLTMLNQMIQKMAQNTSSQ